MPVAEAVTSYNKCYCNITCDKLVVTNKLNIIAIQHTSKLLLYLNGMCEHLDRMFILTSLYQHSGLLYALLQRLQMTDMFVSLHIPRILP